MAEAVFQQWLAQRRADASTSVSAVRSFATKFAQKRLDNEADVNRVTQLALDHFAPDRIHRGRPALGANEAITPQSVAAQWLAGDTNVRPENVIRIVRNFAKRKGLGDLEASETVRLVVEGLAHAQAKSLPTKAATAKAPEPHPEQAESAAPSPSPSQRTPPYPPPTKTARPPPTQTQAPATSPTTHIAADHGRDADA